MLLPLQGAHNHRHTNPGCRFAIPWAMCKLGFQPALQKCIDYNGNNTG